ncbi:hypothetical protein [Legionella oakridgensis]|uniref:Integral membrane protein (PIN domain superfamily) n=2 Tax=Legionella oakridgensis TaxID=29423 RepID=W0BCS1_9GAMM|nr:hypothetical protein [Legionella oakridgensis]AHE66214.1 hypothetical protein Loa_00645 [Legionella oakridgensis ATCC 33761 = DSM 21215]ETO93981.1 hypothetical protein LOR_15c01500 [Legionella oakridgensis RV-2-2007]KTD39736.1 Integral membrane protein (PIN domain superfamily) [Legionella oakridgensis]STY16120.1 Integral membrane protein (PIN domain superfamily) [Legionella longbeachae]
MDVSKFLSKVIGLYEIIISLAMLINMNQFMANIHGLMNNAHLMVYIGCVTAIMGILLVVSHNIWQWHWRVLVTIVAWIVFLKGASILLFPHALDQLTLHFVTNSMFAYSVAVVDLLLGLLFCYFGFRHET